MDDLQKFRSDVMLGLSKSPKQLSSKYFYDEAGSKIFQEIMDMPEYYLPKAELEIIQTQTLKIAESLSQSSLQIIELGAGDGRKMVEFVKKLSIVIPKITYFPLDISQSILEENVRLFKRNLPEIRIVPVSGDFSKTLDLLDKGTSQKLIVFAGSNIGNFRREQAVEFLKMIMRHLKPGDFFLLGVDLKKNPKMVHQAYNDAAGITKRFNLNLLTRINRELGGDFELNSFDHYATYHPIHGAAESFLVSLKDQKVTVGSEVFSFRKNETIQTEISQKYDRETLIELGKNADLEIESFLTDSNGYFAWVMYRQSLA